MVGTRKHRWLSLFVIACAAWYLSGCVTTNRTANAGKVAVVGGASGGFGKGDALELAGQGANRVLAAPRTQLIEQLAQKCERLGRHAMAVTAEK